MSIKKDDLSGMMLTIYENNGTICIECFTKHGKSKKANEIADEFSVALRAVAETVMSRCSNKKLTGEENGNTLH